MYDKNQWIESLQLQAHPEGGFYKEVYRSESILDEESLPATFRGQRNLLTSIYFLIDEDNFSAFHRIKSDELWYFHHGATLIIHVIDDEGCYRSIKLGSNAVEGEVPSAVVKANCWFASELELKKDFALVSCAVAPGFDFQDFELADDALIERYPDHAQLIERLIR